MTLLLLLLDYRRHIGCRSFKADVPVGLLHFVTAIEFIGVGWLLFR